MNIPTTDKPTTNALATTALATTTHVTNTTSSLPDNNAPTAVVPSAAVRDVMPNTVANTTGTRTIQGKYYIIYVCTIVCPPYYLDLNAPYGDTGR